MGTKMKHFGLEQIQVNQGKHVTLEIKFVDTRRRENITVWVLNEAATDSDVAQSISVGKFDLGRSEQLAPGDTDIFIVAKSLNPPYEDTFKNKALMELIIKEDGVETFSKTYTIEDINTSDNPIKFLLHTDFQLT